MNFGSLRKHQWFFIGITLWKLSKNEEKSMIFHRGYPMKIVQKWAKINDFSYGFCQNYEKNLSKIEQNLMNVIKLSLPYGNSHNMNQNFVAPNLYFRDTNPQNLTKSEISWHRSQNSWHFLCHETAFVRHCVKARN